MRHTGTQPGTIMAVLCATALAVTVAMGLILVETGSIVPAGASSASKTVWLCNPTAKGSDPCALSRTATAVTASGATQITSSSTSKSAPKYDCFYVYPTVSSEPGPNANLTIQPAETVVAELQASRFSQVCRVWAPMYRQRTVASLSQGLGAAKKSTLIAYNSLLSGWKDYLAHDNHGRPIIFIGHSQGAAILINLLESQIDPSPKLRAQMVSAIILGGNVQVPDGQDVGGSFKHIPTCGSAAQTGCVVAYSSFNTTPPANALFGIPGQGVSLQSGQTVSSGEEVACVNPVNFSQATGSPLPYFLTASSKVKGVNVKTPWVSFPGLYTATCEHSNGATWLNIGTTGVPGDPRPVATPVLGPTWGLHLDDVNLTLGNLVLDVAFQEAAYRH
jgi:hypothetical protein